ncbi:MAG: butyrate kinase [Candidatus Aminicenantales bacterium]
MRLLIINPGSTSTKIAVYEDEHEVFSENIAHSTEDLAGYHKMVDQKDFRKEIVLKALAAREIDPRSFAAVVGRGGLLKPIRGGTYTVNARLIEDLIAGVQGEHASNLGGLIADEIARPFGLPAYIVDPVVVDELEDWARLTGFPEIRRRSIFHALNHKYTARLAAEALGRPYAELNLIVGHLGGGISVGAHDHGRVIDVNNALNGEGPIAPERAGTLPANDFAALCLSGQFTKDEIKKKIAGKGGMVAHLNTNDLRVVEKKIKEGDARAALVFEAMIITVAKQIGSAAAVLKGKVDAIVLTGGLMFSTDFVEGIKARVSFLGRIFIYPGENEMVALAAAGLRILKGEESAKTYL